MTAVVLLVVEPLVTAAVELPVIPSVLRFFSPAAKLLTSPDVVLLATLVIVLIMLLTAELLILLADELFIVRYCTVHAGGHCAAPARG